MGDYKYGGYCPRCVLPVDEVCGSPFSGYRKFCCPHCGIKASMLRELAIWPEGSFRLVGVWPFRRWEPSEYTKEEARKAREKATDEKA